VRGRVAIKAIILEQSKLKEGKNWNEFGTTTKSVLVRRILSNKKLQRQQAGKV
jgi:hypothetical protein